LQKRFNTEVLIKKDGPDDDFLGFLNRKL